MTKPKDWLSPREWGAKQTPPITKQRATQIYKRIPGARKVRYKADSGRWAYRIEFPADAVWNGGKGVGRPRKEHAKQPRKGAEKRER